MALNTKNGILGDSAFEQACIGLPNDLMPEHEEELKLKAKYPNTNKPGGSQFILKMLTKGQKKYFDSGDYNMAKSKHRLTSLPDSMHNTSLAPFEPNTTFENNRSMNESSAVFSPHVNDSPCSLNNSNRQAKSFQKSNNYLNDLLMENIFDENTIGYEIPTAECLTARKNLIVQSKLATNQL